MKLREIIGKDEITLSFEVFPPKTDTDYAAVEKAACGVAALHPSYMSVIYGAGGSTRGNTVKIAGKLRRIMMLQVWHILPVWVPTGPVSMLHLMK